LVLVEMLALAQASHTYESEGWAEVEQLRVRSEKGGQ